MTNEEICLSIIKQLNTIANALTQIVAQNDERDKLDRELGEQKQFRAEELIPKLVEAYKEIMAPPSLPLSVVIPKMLKQHVKIIPIDPFSKDITTYEGQVNEMITNGYNIAGVGERVIFLTKWESS